MHSARRNGRLMLALRTVAIIAALLPAPTPAPAKDDPAAVSSQDGKYLDKDGNPTFHIAPDGTVDFYTYAGYVRYSANCLQCHGPDGMGSTYAPALVRSLQSLTYEQFMAIVAGGKQDVTAAQTLVMPALGLNRNVMCYLDAIYAYLRARADGALGRGRPPKHDPKPAEFAKDEDACME
jgi:methanol metabolism-related c-type cytochrome